MDKVIERLKWIAYTSYNHKFKLIFLLGTLYLMKKAYDMYTFIKPILSMLGYNGVGGMFRRSNQN